jgi:hypothetical protein
MRSLLLLLWLLARGQGYKTGWQSITGAGSWAYVSRFCLEENMKNKVTFVVKYPKGNTNVRRCL